MSLIEHLRRILHKPYDEGGYDPTGYRMRSEYDRKGIGDLGDVCCETDLEDTLAKLRAAEERIRELEKEKETDNEVSKETSSD